MAARANPAGLLLQWRLQNSFELLFCEPGKDGRHVKKKRMGTVSEKRTTKKGKEGNNGDQVLMLINTRSMEDDAAPFALLMRLLDLTGLEQGLFKSYKKAV